MRILSIFLLLVAAYFVKLTVTEFRVARPHLTSDLHDWLYEVVPGKTVRVALLSGTALALGFAGIRVLRGVDD